MADKENLEDLSLKLEELEARAVVREVIRGNETAPQALVAQDYFERNLRADGRVTIFASAELKRIGAVH